MSIAVTRTPASRPGTPAEPQGRLERFRRVRQRTLELAAPLSAEDQVVQSMPDASPVKWHLAHTSWFFETFLLGPAGVESYDPSYGFLFNSYYEAVGARQPRPRRGLITRPSLEDVRAYRSHVDRAMEALLQRPVEAAVAELVDLGIAHEEQHQELILTDVLHLLAQNPLRPAYRAGAVRPYADPGPMSFVPFAGGVAEIGFAGEGFAFDNEGPRHRIYLQPFALADRLATNAEWLAFMGDGGYARPELWLSDGWARAREEDWSAPLYWQSDEGGWREFTLNGLVQLDPHAPVRHVSFYEADAFARWRGARLPSEAEWEHGVLGAPALRQAFGEAWQWTASAYAPYPGFRPSPGAVGEYNGKFMVNQLVLRGSSPATAPGHARATYRNFFYPHQRWQFTGVRLAGDAR